MEKATRRETNATRGNSARKRPPPYCDLRTSPVSSQQKSIWGVTAADAFGDPGFERGLAGLDPVEKFAVGKPDFTGELSDRKPRGAQHEAQTLFVAAKVIGAGTAGMGERIHDTAFFTARPKNERGLLLHYPTWRLW